jgi:aspartate-semialdehyde dehydrogenase
LARDDARVAVVGATGIVGGQIAALIGERDFPWAELSLFGTHSSAEGVESGDRMLTVARLADPADLSGFDFVFLAIPREPAAAIIAARPGPVLIDLSAAMLADAGAISAPGLTDRERLGQLAQGGVLAVPHPAAHVIASILAAIGNRSFAGASVMLSASAGGHQAVSKLFEQSVDVLNARLDLPDDETQLAFNVFAPANARELAATITAQIAALGVDASNLLVNLASVQAFHGGAVAMFIPRTGEMSEWSQRLRSAPGVIVVEGDDVSGLIDAVGQEAVIVRISQNVAGMALWCVFDGARLAALDAIWIAETLAGLRS